jgi:PBP1b-binding outer membrane lipoprotein LpoB
MTTKAIMKQSSFLIAAIALGFVLVGCQTGETLPETKKEDIQGKAPANKPGAPDVSAATPAPVGSKDIEAGTKLSGN